MPDVVYSSGISDESHNRKEKKKEAIKECLQQLKSLMPQQGKSKAGTVSTLKTVLQHMKKIKGTELCCVMRRITNRCSNDF